MNSARVWVRRRGVGRAAQSAERVGAHPEGDVAAAEEAEGAHPDPTGARDLHVLLDAGRVAVRVVGEVELLRRHLLLLRHLLHHRLRRCAPPPPPLSSYSSSGLSAPEGSNT